MDRDGEEHTVIVIITLQAILLSMAEEFISVQKVMKTMARQHLILPILIFGLYFQME